MKKYLALPLAVLAFAAACDDSSKGLLAPEAPAGGPEFHIVTAGDAHSELYPTITAASGTTASWDAPSGSNADRWVYLVKNSDGSTAVTATTITAVKNQVGYSVSLSLPNGNNYQLWVRGERDGNGTEPVHAPVWATQTFSVQPAGSSDRAAPTVTCTVPNQTLWYGANVVVSCTAQDASGLASSSPSPFTLSTSVSAGAENAAAQTDSKVISDIHGNSVTAGPFTFKVDRKAPTYSCGTAPTGWQNTDVTISCTGSDTGSGIMTADASFSLSTNVGAGNENGSASTGSRTITDNAGNHATAGPITGLMIDLKAPVIACGTVPTDWFATNQSVSCTAVDGGSGLANSADASFLLSTNLAAGSESNNVSTTSKNVADAVGNSAPAGPLSPFSIDRKGPAIQCIAASFTLNQSPATVTANVSDSGSGVASNIASATANASSVGTQTVSVSAADLVSNSSTASCAYSVTYVKTAFLEPIPADANYLSRAFKAGSTIPVKFQLRDANGSIITTAKATISFAKVSSETSGDSPESFTAQADAGNNFRYSTDGQQYIFNLGTSKTQVGTYRITATLDDGTTISQRVVLK